MRVSLTEGLELPQGRILELVGDRLRSLRLQRLLLFDVIKCHFLIITNENLGYDRAQIAFSDVGRRLSELCQTVSRFPNRRLRVGITDQKRPEIDL